MQTKLVIFNQSVCESMFATANKNLTTFGRTLQEKSGRLIEYG